MQRLVPAFASTARLVLAQEAALDKASEIAAISAAAGTAWRTKWAGGRAGRHRRYR